MILEYLFVSMFIIILLCLSFLLNLWWFHNRRTNLFAPFFHVSEIKHFRVSRCLNLLTIVMQIILNQVELIISKLLLLLNWLKFDSCPYLFVIIVFEFHYCLLQCWYFLPLKFWYFYQCWQSTGSDGAFLKINLFDKMLQNIRIQILFSHFATHYSQYLKVNFLERNFW